jgi:outer membrane protein
MTRRLRGVAVALGLAAAIAAVPVASADQYKIGVIHIERIMRDSPPARAALARIEQEFKPRDTAIAAKEQEVRAATAQYEKDKAGLDADARAARERDLEVSSRDVERQRQQFAEDLRVRQFEELDKLKEQLDKVLTRLAHDQGYDLILQSALWVGKSVDITDDVIKALGP